jgi:hypothetical protein
MNPVWTIDITYIRAGRCIYLASVLDLYARRVVDYAISDIADAALAIAALDMAWQQCVKPKGGHISFCASKQRWRIGCSQGAIRSNKNESLWKSLR